MLGNSKSIHHTFNIIWPGRMDLNRSWQICADIDVSKTVGFLRLSEIQRSYLELQGGKITKLNFAIITALGFSLPPGPTLR